MLFSNDEFGRFLGLKVVNNTITNDSMSDDGVVATDEPRGACLFLVFFLVNEKRR